MGCEELDDEWATPEEKRRHEAALIRGRVAQHPAPFSLLNLEESLLLWKAYMDGQHKAPSEVELRMLRAIEKKLAVDIKQ